jgi:methyltransferase family protein
MRARGGRDARLRATRRRQADGDRSIGEDDRGSRAPQRRVRGGGEAEFLVAELEQLDLGDRRFDVIFAVRVAFFHREPERARALIEPWLAPGGRVRAFFDLPGRA